MLTACSALASVPRISNVSGLRPKIRHDAPKRAQVAVNAYSVTLKTEEGDKVIEVADDVYILDAAEEAGIDLPYSCRSGTCSSCAGKIVSGTVDQTEQSFLDDKMMGAGFALLCVSYPTSDLVIETDKESEVMG